MTFESTALVTNSVTHRDTMPFKLTAMLNNTICFVFAAIVLTESILQSSLTFAQESPSGFHQQLKVFLTSENQSCEIDSSADWEIRREQILENVERVMGRLPPRVPVPFDLQILSTKVEDDIQFQKISYRTDSLDGRVTAWLLRPSKASSDRPLVPGILCLHQTVGIGKDEPVGNGGSPHLHYALELTKRGFITLSPDYPSLGEYAYDFANPKHGPRYESGSMKAIVDNRRAIDLLQGTQGVLPDAIGCIGHSLGGHNSIFTALFDQRIRAIVSCCGFTRFHKYYEGKLKGWSGPRYMPRIESDFGNDPNQVPFDFPELIAALAPRPFLAVSPLRDANFEVSGVRDTIEAARPVYQLFHRPEHLQVRYPNCEHDFPDEDREAAYLFFEQHLIQAKR